MDQTSARPSTLRPPAFRDGLGERRRMADASGIEKLEILCIRRELAAVDSFESSLRDGLSRLANFRSPGFARVRTVERLNDHAATLVVASEPVQGVRLSELLGISNRHGLSMDGSAKWCLIKQLVAAVCTLHRHAAETAHGAIAAERIVVTPDAHVILVEHVLGSALQQLKFSPDRYWKELRVACPPSAAATHLNQRADVAQMGVVALSVILGRTLKDDEYPSRIAELLESGWATADQRPTPTGLRSWLARALQLDAKDAFASAIEANNALDRAIVESGYMIASSDLEAFLALCQEPHDESAPKTTPVAVVNKPESAKAAAAPVPTEAVPMPAAAAPAKPVVKAQEKCELAKAAPVTAQSSKPAPATKAAPPKPAPKLASAPQPQVKFAALEAAESDKPDASKGYLGSILSTAATSTWHRKAAAVALLTVVSGAGWAAANRFFDGSEKVMETPAPIESVPTVNMTAPAPEVAAISTPIAPLSPPTGQLDVRTDPPGATVTIGGQRRGVTPLTITDLAPGRHTVVLEGSSGSLTRNVTIEPGTTASLVTDLESAPATGFLTVTAPSAVEILENGRLIGTSQGGRLALPTGPHQLEIVNPALGFRITRTVQVSAGANTPIALEFPKGTLALNAIPWAEVFVDGQRVGDTPIGNLAVTLGSHEVIFRNPDLGEQRMTATVTLTAPTRLSVDLRKR